MTIGRLSRYPVFRTSRAVVDIRKNNTAKNRTVAEEQIKKKLKKKNDNNIHHTQFIQIAYSYENNGADPVQTCIYILFFRRLTLLRFLRPRAPYYRVVAVCYINIIYTFFSITVQLHRAFRCANTMCNVYGYDLFHDVMYNPFPVKTTLMCVSYTFAAVFTRNIIGMLYACWRE